MKISDKEFQDLAALIRKNYGIDLKEEKKSLVINRLINFLRDNGFKSFNDYYNHVISDFTGSGVISLVDRITTNHTFFMREKEHFEYLKKEILPWIETTSRDRDIRIWSAGCSSGEEPYTIAMVLDEYFSLKEGKWDKKILATDISQRVLEKAKAGIYKKEETVGMPKTWMNMYFKLKKPDVVEIAPKIKNEVIYRKFNLMDKQFPFRKKFHVIFCRNVMIYFDNETKQELLRKFYEITEDGGYLLIGHSETINNLKTGYKYLKPSIYRKG